MIVPDLVNDALFVCHLSRAAPKALVVVLGDQGSRHRELAPGNKKRSQDKGHEHEDGHWDGTL